MNKKLIAVAIGAALSGSAFAQSSNVTLYGRINTAIESNQTGKAGSEVQMRSYSSRLGVRGTEDLGGGLSGVFGIETQLASDSGASGLATNLRNAYIGVDSKTMGRVTLGRLDAAVGLGSAPLYQQVTSVIDLVGYDTGAGQFINAAPTENSVLTTGAASTGTANLTTGAVSTTAGTASGVSTIAGSRLTWATTGGNTINIQQRASNAVSYGIKSGDFTVGARLQMSGLDGGSGTAAQGENNARLFEVAGSYVSGPLTLGVGYETQSLGKAEELLAANAIRFDDRFQAVAGYAVNKDLKVGASFARNSIESQAGTALADKSGNEIAFSGTYSLDAKNSVVVNYGSRDLIANANGTRNDAKRKQFAVGYRYDFSKRTQGYALYNTVDPDSNVGDTGAATDKVKSVIVGLRHNF